MSSQEKNRTVSKSGDLCAVKDYCYEGLLLLRIIVLSLPNRNQNCKFPNFMIVLASILMNVFFEIFANYVVDKRNGIFLEITTTVFF